MNCRFHSVLLAGSLVYLAVFVQSGRADEGNSSRIDRNIDRGWKFIRSDATGAQAENFDDSSWQPVDLPYTWNTDKTPNGVTYYRGPAWYRSHLTVGPELTGKSLFLRFGAASLVARVYINGRLVGTHIGGFGAFCFDVTSSCRPGDNVIAVRVDNSPKRNVSPLSGDFTLFGGLYRDVELIALSTVSISPLDDASCGVYLRTKVTDASARIEVTSKLRNSTEYAAKVTVVCTIFDATGQPVQHSSTDQVVTANSTADAVEALTIVNPHLWNGRIDPYLYEAVVEVSIKGLPVDRVKQPLGLRFFRVDPEQGLILTG
jgi:beta-galactosidase